jgi:diguanylate cyclase (GGDEF)-like protein
LFSDVQRLAVTDPLTGLYNRRGFFALAHREIERARRFKRELSAVLLDIDHFKNVNDTYKHATGDVVLRVLAEVCKRETREIDIIGRYGGEEIVLLLPETSLESAYVVAEHLRKAVAATKIPIGGETISVTISLGIADSVHGEPDLDTLIDRADAAMYNSKQSGRNCVRSFQDRQSISS